MAKIISQLPSGGTLPKHNDLQGLNEDNYIHLTQLEKANLDNQSGINTGDETTSSIQTKRPLKTVDGKSLEGTGNIEIDYNTVINKPTEFPPSAHTHIISEVVNLQNELNSKENISNKVNIISGNSSTEYPTEKAVVEYISSQIGADFAKVVYFDNVTPNVASIFDLNNPPLVNDPSLKEDVANLYIGTDASTWVYITSPEGYVTKTVTSSGSNFYITGTNTDAGSIKTGSITKKGQIVIDSEVVNDSGLTLKKTESSILKTDSLGKVVKATNLQDVEYAPIVHTHTVSQITDFPTFKTIENQSIVGAGNIDLNKSDVGLSNVDNTSDVNKPVSTVQQNALDLKANIIHSLTHELGGTDVIQGENLSVNVIPPTNNYSPVTSTLKGHLQGIDQALGSVQSTLVSGTTIKTIEGQSILGSGNIDITKSDVGLPLADNTSDASKSVLSSTKLTTPRSINGVNFDGTSNITINAVDSTPRIAVSEKAQANGVATLGTDGKIPNSQIPALAISETFPVASQAAMLALPSAEQGDVAVRTDISKSFILTQSPASTLSNWQELLTPTDAVQSVNGQTGNVTLTTSNISEGSNLYYTEGRVSANTNVAANTAARHSAVTLDTTNGLSLSGQHISLALASTSTVGALSSTDWNTFNSKQNALGFTPENVSNKSDSYTVSSSTTYASTKALVDGLATKQNSIGYTPANDANVVHLTGNETITGSKVFTGANTRFDIPLLLKKSGLSEYNQVSSFSGKLQFTENSGTKFNFSMGSDYFDFGIVSLDKVAKITNTLLSANRTYDLPNASGTIALTSDIPSSSSYIQNQNSSAQAANMWISGTGKFDVLAINNDLVFTNSVDKSEIQSYNSKPLHINRQGNPVIFGGLSTFSLAVTAPTFVGNLNGNASSATTWGGYGANFNVEASVFDYIAVRDGANGLKLGNVTGLRSWLGLGSNAYTSTAFAPITGGAGYIQNQNASAQSANMWISGTGTFQRSNAVALESNILGSFGQTLKMSRIGTGVSVGLGIVSSGELGFYSNNSLVGSIKNSGAATFASTVTATNFLSNDNNNGYNIDVNKTGGFGSSLALKNSSLSSNALIRFFKPNNIDFYNLYTSSTGIELDGTVTASNGTLIGGTLTSGYIPKATGTNSLGNSVTQDFGYYIQHSFTGGGSLGGLNYGVDNIGAFYNSLGNYGHRWLTNSGGIEAMSITSGGNVGIGTSSPLSKIHSYSTSPYIGSQGITSESDSNTITLGSGSSGSSTYETNYMGVNESGLLSNKNMRFSIYGAAGNYFKWSNNGSEQMRITSGGNVGIGTTSPSAKLQVIGNASGWGGWIENQEATGVGSGLVVTGGTNAGGFSLLVRKQDGTSTFAVSGNGNVGIGTTNPLQKFVVSNTGSNGFEVAVHPTASDGVVIQSYDRQAVLYRPSTYSASKHVFDIGNVLIGTTTDNGHKLQVNGSGSFSEGVKSITSTERPFTFRATGSGSNYGLFLQNNGSPLAYLGDANGSAIAGGSVADFAVVAPNGKLFLKGNSGVIVPPLSGSGTRMVTADASGNLSTQTIPSSTEPYLVYTALISQSGTNAPTATVLRNTLGGTVVWSYIAPGWYSATLTGAFTASNTVAFINGDIDTDDTYGIKRADTNEVFVISRRLGITSDEVLQEATVEIRVYPLYP